MEYYTEEELSLRKLKKPLLLSLAILIVTIFVDIAPLLQKLYVGYEISFTAILTQIAMDFEVALITFVVSNFIYESITHSSIINYFIWIVTVIGFVSLVLFKFFNNNLWLIFTVFLSVCTVILLCIYCIKIKNIVKKEGRRMPC